MGLGAAKNIGRHLAHDAGNQVAIALQPGVVQVAGLLKVHLATLNHLLQVSLFDGIVGGQRHQRTHHRVAGLARKGLRHFGLPPGQFAGCHTSVKGVVHDVVDFAAKGIKGGDCGAPWRRQE